MINSFSEIESKNIPSSFNRELSGYINGAEWTEKARIKLGTYDSPNLSELTPVVYPK
jgi:hypothetical protein